MRRIVSIVIFVNFVVIVGAGYCLNLDKIKAAYLNGEYQTAVSEGEKILLTSINHAGFDELYYCLGLSYLKDGNFIRSADMFNRILSEFPDGKYRSQAQLALGDVYFLQGDFEKAKSAYEALAINSDQKLRSALLYRQSQLALKMGDSAKNKELQEQLKSVYPFSLEAKQDKGVFISVAQAPEPAETKTEPKEEAKPEPAPGDFSVQVGVFSNKENATNLATELLRKGFGAYAEDAEIEGKASYRVRVGKSSTQQEAVELEKQLQQQGYPTKICQ
jgi:outer membrane protein assembly factor BamD (BamD/ComL family)